MDAPVIRSVPLARILGGLFFGVVFWLYSGKEAQAQTLQETRV